MPTARRLNSLDPDGPRLALFKLWDKPDRTEALNNFDAAGPFFSDFANTDERLLACFLTLLSQGQIAASSLLGQKKDTELRN